MTRLHNSVPRPGLLGHRGPDGGRSDTVVGRWEGGGTHAGSALETSSPGAFPLRPAADAFQRHERC